MILLVARRELLGHLRSPRMRALLALVVALLATGAFVNVRRFEERVRYADALESMRAVTAALERDDPENVASRFGWRGGRVIADPALRAVRPPAPASVLALGADLAAPGFWQFGTEGVSAGPAQDADADTAADPGTLDVAFVVRVVLSLVAVLLAAETIAGDRERGLLRALFAAPVSRLDVLSGKYVGGLLTLCVPVCAGMLAAAVVMLLARAPLLGPGVGVRLLSLAIGAVVFLAAMLALGVLVSARCRDGQTAVVAAVSVWALLVVVLPGGASLVASVVRPVTPDELQRQARSEGIRQLEVERAHALAAVWRRVAGTDEVPLDGVASPALRRAYDAARLPVEAELMRRKRALLRGATSERRRERDAQARLVAWVDALSPAGAFARFAATVVGTGAPALSRWERAVDDQQARLEAATFDRPYGTELFAARERYLRITYLPNTFDPNGRVPRYDELPPFSAPDPDLAADVRAALPSFVALLAHALMCLLLATHAVLRMEV